MRFRFMVFNATFNNISLYSQVEDTQFESNRGSKLFFEEKDLGPVWNMEPVVAMIVWYFYTHLYNQWLSSLKL
jgi:hypothetical protein